MSSTLLSSKSSSQLYTTLAHMLWHLMINLLCFYELVSRNVRRLKQCLSPCPSWSKTPRHVVLLLQTRPQKEKEWLRVTQTLMWIATLAETRFVTVAFPGDAKDRFDAWHNVVPHLRRRLHQQQEMQLETRSARMLATMTPSLSETKPFLRVNFVDLQDGKRTLAKALLTMAKDLSLQSPTLPTGDVACSSWVEDRVQGSVQNSLWPEPDLLLRVGPLPCQLGFQPWLTRSTEMHQLPSLAEVTWQDVCDALDKFSKSQQRWGK